MRKVFWLITLSLPVLILVLLETGLRIAHYGGDLDLVLPRTVGGREYYMINRAVAHRYFAGQSVLCSGTPGSDVSEDQRAACAPDLLPG